MSAPQYILSNKFLSVVLKGTPYNVLNTDARFPALKKAISERKWTAVEKILVTQNSITRYSNGKLSIKDNHVYYNGEILNNTITAKILEFIESGHPFIPLANFLNKLNQNPSRRSVESLYPFIEQYKLPITDDGDFLAYKSITLDKKDHHTKSIDNTVGKVVILDRNKISDDPNVPCHFGLHIGTYNYVKSFNADQIISVNKINPCDVVCVPYDASHGKIRVCRYEVVKHIANHTQLKDFTSNYAPKNQQVQGIKGMSVRGPDGRFIKKSAV